MSSTKWGRPRLAVVAAAMIALASAPGAARAASASAPPQMKIARVGSASGAKRIALELPLKIDTAGLSRFAAAVTTPGSPRYGQYEPVATLARRFGAPTAERAHVVSYLRRAGATGVRVDPTGLFADATMRVARAERLFGAHLDAFRAQARPGGAAQRFVAPARAARVPAALRGAVTGVVGLDTRPLAPPPAAVHSDASPSSAYSGYNQRTGTATGCPAALARPGFTPNQYLTAYGYSALQQQGLRGQGERVALIEIDGFKGADVRAFARCFSLHVPPIHAYGVGIKKALAPGGESTLDLELLTAAAPSLKDVDVYESRPVASTVLRSLTSPLTVKGRTPEVISASLGACEPATQAAVGKAGINAVQSTLQLAAASGISVLASSGDDGSTACVNSSNKPVDVLAVNYPASSPWVTGVGGTNIILNSQNAIADPAADQKVWNDEPALLGAGGGGTSTFKRPAYQKGFVASPRREVPDVSMLADPLPGYEIYCTARTDCVKGSGSSRWLNFGGTSAGTPLLAGGFALIDQALRRAGRENLGFANPLLYKVARSPTAASTIADVTLGSNDISGAVFGRSLSCCSAAPGYDPASGLGSVNLGGLAAVATATMPKQVRVSLRLPRQRKPIAGRHLTATVTCTGECLMGAYAKIHIAGTRKTLTQYSSVYKLIKRRSRTIRIGFDNPTLAKLRAALSEHRRITATVYGALVSPSGGVTRHSAGRRLTINR